MLRFLHCRDPAGADGEIGEDEEAEAGGCHMSNGNRGLEAKPEQCHR